MYVKGFKALSQAQLVVGLYLLHGKEESTGFGHAMQK